MIIFLIICIIKGRMAASGKEISSAFKIVVNSVNGTSLALSTGATVNNLIFMIDNIDDMSALDITFQCISIAFWAKGYFYINSLFAALFMSAY